VTAVPDHGSRTRSRVFLICPSCGLSISPRATWLAIEHCPRCLARARTTVPLLSSPLPASALYDERTRPGAGQESKEVTERDARRSAADPERRR
jgi:hypothetical protein